MPLIIPMMKLALALLPILLFHASHSTQRICKTQVIRSFGLQSRVAPNNVNALCPQISFNCCTRRDQMKIHKMWKETYKQTMQSTSRNNLSMFERLGTFLQGKDQFVLQDILTSFAQTVNPPETFLRHLTNIVGEYNRRNSKFYTGLMTNLKVKLNSMRTDVVRYRQSIFCTICDWNAHNYFNPQSLTVTYSQQFCLANIVKFLDTLWDKYSEIFRLMNIMDEFLFLITGRKLFAQKDRATFHRYYIMLAKCRKDSTKIDNCGDVCREYNLNRYKYLWDGEARAISTFLKNYEADWTQLLESQKYQLMFQFRKNEWTQDRINTYIKMESVLSQAFVEPAEQIHRKKNTFDLSFKSNAIKNFIQHRHPVNTVQIETLDDELSSYQLYKMVDPPIDVSSFMIVFDPNGGINPEKQSDEMNFDVSVDQLLALLHTSGSNVRALDEIIDPPVALLLKGMTISDIADFINDSEIDFA